MAPPRARARAGPKEDWFVEMTIIELEIAPTIGCTMLLRFRPVVDGEVKGVVTMLLHLSTSGIEMGT